MSFYDGQLKQQLCYSFTLLINFLYPWFLINLKWWSSSFRQHQVFPTLMVEIFSAIQQAPGPDFRKVGKSLYTTFIDAANSGLKKKIEIYFNT